MHSDESGESQKWKTIRHRLIKGKKKSETAAPATNAAHYFSALVQQCESFLIRFSHTDRCECVSLFTKPDYPISVAWNFVLVFSFLFCFLSHPRISFTISFYSCCLCVISFIFPVNSRFWFQQFIFDHIIFSKSHERWSIFINCAIDLLNGREQGKERARERRREKNRLVDVDMDHVSRNFLRDSVCDRCFDDIPAH